MARIDRVQNRHVPAKCLSGKIATMPDNSPIQNLAINWKESLYLATRGGSRALGSEGAFIVGAPFDAQESKRSQSILQASTLLMIT